jgi:hypothetical protein
MKVLMIMFPYQPYKNVISVTDHAHVAASQVKHPLRMERNFLVALLAHLAASLI